MAPFREGFTATIDLVFLIAAGVVAIGFFVFLFLPQLALSDKSGIQAAQQAEAGGRRPAAADAGEQAPQAVGRRRADVHAAAGRPPGRHPAPLTSACHRHMRPDPTAAWRARASVRCRVPGTEHHAGH